MLEVIPAIDLRSGRCVRLLQGDFARETVFGHDPVGMARHWEGQGARRLHVVDLDGARLGAPAQLPLVADIVRAVGIPVELGGGLRRPADLEAAFATGVERVVIGTAAIDAEDGTASSRPFRDACQTTWANRVIIGLDARDGKLAVRGWTTTTEQDAFAFASQLRAEGFRRIVYTDIRRDGALSGPNLDHIARLARIPGLAVIASGGIANVTDLEALEAAGAEAAIIGQALYTGRLSLAETRQRPSPLTP